MPDSDLPHSLKIVTLWSVAGIAVFLAVQWWQSERQRATFHSVGEVVELRRAADGHYHWPGRINGRRVDFLVDTGASSTAIPAELARDLRLETIDTVQSSTAGGVVTGNVVRADVALAGGLRADRLRVVALEGLDTHPLLGMDLLGRLHLEQRAGVLRIGPGEPR
jgi:aspartyl protease family protein